MLSGDDEEGLLDEFSGRVNHPCVFFFFLVCAALHESSCILFSPHTVIGNSLTTDCQKSKSLAPCTGAVIPEMTSG